MTRLAINGGPPVIESKKYSSWPNIKDEDRQEINDYLLKKNKLSIAGKQGVVEELENNFAQLCNRKYSVSMNSGTNCLFAALFAIGIEKDDEVIVPDYGFHACASSIYLMKAVPVLCDCEKDLVNISPDKIEKLITKRTKAIVVVHNWGHSADIIKIREIAKKYNIFLIEDCSHAHGSKFNNMQVGSFGDIAFFSLNANKTVFAGDGGILLTDNTEFFNRSVLLGHYRSDGYVSKNSKYFKFNETGYGLKFRIHPLGAILANCSFYRMDETIEQRNIAANIISSGLDKISLINKPVIKNYVTSHSFYGYKPVYIGSNDAIKEIYLKALYNEGVEIRATTYQLNHQLPLFKNEKRYISSMEDTSNKKKQLQQFNNAIKLNNRLLTIELPNVVNYKWVCHKYVEAFKKVEENMDIIKWIAQKNNESDR